MHRRREAAQERRLTVPMKAARRLLVEADGARVGGRGAAAPAVHEQCDASSAQPGCTSTVWKSANETPRELCCAHRSRGPRVEPILNRGGLRHVVLKPVVWVVLACRVSRKECPEAAAVRAWRQQRRP